MTTVKQTPVDFTRSRYGRTLINNVVTYSLLEPISRLETNIVTYGDNLPNWRDLIRDGKDATTSLQARKYTISKLRTGQGYSITGSQNNVRNEISGYITAANIQFVQMPYTPDTFADTQAILDLNKELRKRTTHWNGGVFLGELREAARFLRNPVKSLWDITEDLSVTLRRLKRVFLRPPGVSTGSRRLTRRDWQKYQKALADAWLAYQYAAKPLASDCNDAAKAIRALSQGRTFDIVRLRGYGLKESATRTLTSVGVTGVGSTGAQQEITRNTVNSVLIRGGWKNETPHGMLPVPMQFGMDIFDVIPTAYELIPYSFLLDYFSNVGDVLDAFRLRFMTWSYLNRTVRNSRTDRGHRLITIPDFTPGHERGNKGGELVCKSTAISRSKLSPGELVPSFYMEAPGFPSLKWLNIAALANNFRLARP